MHVIKCLLNHKEKMIEKLKRLQEREVAETVKINRQRLSVEERNYMPLF